MGVLNVVSSFISLIVMLLWILGEQGGVEASWFPKMTLSDSEWQNALMKFDVSSSYSTCKNEYTSGAGGDNRFIAQYKDKPVTFVIVGSGSGSMDVKFKDASYVFEHKFELSDEKYLVIPPYQPVEWLYMRVGSKFQICSYTDTAPPSDTNNQANDCDCTSIVKSASSISSVTFPHTIRKPEQEFFLTAEITPQENDVTICTILTVDRLLRLSQMSDMWDGPISAAVYLHELNEVEKVMEWYLSHNSMRRHVDIHLVQDDKLVAFELPDRPFPVNILRNVALRFARTANVLYIEGDFIPSPDLYSSLDDVKRRLATGEKAVFIVAPFSTDKAEFDMKLFPQDKKALAAMIEAGNSPIRDLSYFNSHAAFKFHDWFKSTSMYEMGFSGGYEPYYIGPKTYPLFEEIFIGCGADKVSHPAELFAAGYKFFVLPTGFIVHIDSTGMGSAWCRGWAGNARSTMKWEAFSTKTSHIYHKDKTSSFDSRIPWWDLAPVILGAGGVAERGKGKGGGGGRDTDDEVCLPPAKEKECPKCEECQKCEKCEVCPECPKGPGCPPPTKAECARFTDAFVEDLASVKGQMAQAEETHARRKADITSLEETVRTLRAENAQLAEYSRFVVHVGIGVVVVMAVVVGVGVCVWPRNNKRVWVLPTWKATHHNL